MIVALFLIVISPFTALLPAIYTIYIVFSKRLIVYKNPWNIGLCLLFIWSLFSGIISGSYISATLSLVLFIYLCLSIYLQNNFKDEVKIEKLCQYLVYFSLFSALIGIIEKLTFTYFNSTIWKNLLGLGNEHEIIHRIYSTFGNPNVTGNWFAIMILIATYMSSKTRKKHKLFYQLSIILFIIILFMTGSRGAYIGLVAGLSIYYSLEKDNKIIYLILFFAVVAIIAFLPFQILSLDKLMGHDFSNSYSSRYQIWVGCIKMIKLKPITGWGLMGIYNFGFKYIDFHAKVYHAQNLWISIITTLGVVGFLIYLYMKIYLYKTIVTLNKNKCRIIPLLAGIQALILGHGLVDFTLMTPQAGLLFISCSALICSLNLKYNPKASTDIISLKFIK
jgi:putative inorganic carbon (hco3(-)) transporter